MLFTLKHILQSLNERAAMPVTNNKSGIVAPVAAAQPSNASQEYNAGLDFTNFERTIATYTENAKNQLQAKLLNLTNGKQVSLRSSKGYGQPIKDYIINVKNVSIDYYYDRYVIVLKDENDKEYFLEPNSKIRILGPAQIIPKKKKKKPAVDPNQPTPVQPALASNPKTDKQNLVPENFIK